MIPRQCNGWLDPKLGFSVTRYHVYMHLFFSRKEEEPVSLFSEYGRAHGVCCFRLLVYCLRFHCNDKLRWPKVYRAVVKYITNG